MILPLPDAPANGDGLSVIAWALVAVLAVIVGGAGVLVAKLTPLIQTMLRHILETKALATSMADSVNHRHPGAPTLLDHSTAARAAIERVETLVEDLDSRNTQTHSELFGDVSALKAWSRKWDDLPPELGSDRALVAKVTELETGLGKVAASLAAHIATNTEETT